MLSEVEVLVQDTYYVTLVVKVGVHLDEEDLAETLPDEEVLCPDCKEQLDEFGWCWQCREVTDAR